MLQRIFLIASGANAKTLDLPECQAERGKYAMIGFGICSTSLLAAFSGGYALFTVCKSVEIAAGLGTFYGFIIGNIDRFLVASTKKEDRFSVSQAVNLSTRLVLAVFVGLVISKPLELKIFEKTIMAEITLENQKTIAKAEDELREKYQEIPELEGQIKEIKKEVNNKQKIRDDAYKATIEEAEAISGTLKKGKGIVFIEKEREYQKQEREYQELKKEKQGELNKLEKRIDELKVRKDAEAAKIKTTQEAATDILTQLKTLDHLGEKEPVINKASWAITLLLIILDTAPIIAKMFLKKSIYDLRLESEEKVNIAIVEAMEPELISSSIEIKIAEQKLLSALYQKAAFEAFLNAQNYQALTAAITKASFEKILAFIQRKATFLGWL